MLKKVIVLFTVFGSTLPVLADDALVLPEGVVRTRIIPSLSTFDEGFDADGERQDSDKVSLTTLSLALEYGVTDWLTAGVQWAPGLVIDSEIDGFDGATLNGAYDLFAGAKVLLLGESGLAASSDKFRFAVTPGIKIPLSSYDVDEQIENFQRGEDFKPGRTDRGALGFGSRFALDYQVTPNFYFNLYNQSTFFMEATQDYDASLALFGQPVNDVDVQYAPELIFEGEPYYSLSLAKGVELGFGLPLTYTTSGETEIDGEGLDDATTSLELGPYASVFFTDWALPMQFELGYSTTLAGENTPAVNTVSLQVKNFLRF